MTDNKDKQPQPKPSSDSPPRPKSRVQVGSQPFTLHIADTPENVARALFGKPLKRE